MRAPSLLVSALFVSALGLLDSDAQAQAVSGQIVFDAVSAYSAPFPAGSGSYGIAITGVQHGASASSTVLFVDKATATDTTISGTLQTCERQALVVINRPGRFSLGLLPTTAGAIGVPAGGPYSTAYYLSTNGCTLAQLP
jgi:hypothetical protein